MISANKRSRRRRKQKKNKHQNCYIKKKEVEETREEWREIIGIQANGVESLALLGPKWERGAQTMMQFEMVCTRERTLTPSAAHCCAPSMALNTCICIASRFCGEQRRQCNVDSRLRGLFLVFFVVVVAQLTGFEHMSGLDVSWLS